MALYSESVRTVYTVLQETSRLHTNEVALHQPTGSKGKAGYRTFTWAEWEKQSKEIALGLVALGLEKGGVVCLLSETRAEFYLADLAVMAAGGISAALYTSYPLPEQVATLGTIDPKFLFVENPKTLAALSEVASGQLPRHVVLLSGEAEGTLSLERLRELGRELDSRDPEMFERILNSISPEEPAILYMTSGATGTPKMSLTSHAAVLSNIDLGPAVLPIGPKDSTLVFLPAAHIAQRIVLELLPMRMGTPVWFSESLSRLPVELKSIRPTFFLAPPRVWERMYATICNEVRKRPAVARRIFYTSLGLGMEANRLEQAGKPVPGWMKRALKLANKLVFHKVRERLGGRIRIAASGAAPLGKDLSDFFAAIGMPLIEGYGLTETGVVSFNPLEAPKAGSIGKLLQGVEARIAEDGEFFIKSPGMFSGYYKDEEATRSVLSPDGWMATGDIAEKDNDDYFFITGRKKELIVASNGKKIYPAKIENLFKMEPVVNQIVLVGDKQPYITALITVNLPNVLALNGSEEIKDQETSAALQSKTVEKHVKAAVDRVNNQLADFERIRRFKVMPRDLSIEYGELTPTMKVRRSMVLENHRSLIAELYLGKQES
jgi:long-chain acyl-CoA synthetase